MLRIFSTRRAVLFRRKSPAFLPVKQRHFSSQLPLHASDNYGMMAQRDHNHHAKIYDNNDDDDNNNRTPLSWWRLLVASGVAVMLVGGTLAVEDWQQKRRTEKEAEGKGVLDSRPTPFINDPEGDIIKIHTGKGTALGQLEHQLVNMFQYMKLEMGRYPALYSLIGANVGIFVLSRFGMASPRLLQLFMRNFVLSNKSLYLRNAHTMVTHMFAHTSLMHIGLNMYGLYLMSPTLIELFGPSTFLAFYFTCGIGSAVGSLLIHALLRSSIRGSMGASGAVFGVLAASIAIRPDDTRLQLIFLPWFSFDPKIFLPLYLLGEIVYNMVQKGAKLDTGAHVTGALTGVLALWLLRNMEHNQRKRVTAINMRTSFYMGEMVRYRKEGKGLLVLPNLAYAGGFKKDKFHGTGVVRNTRNHRIITGQFKEGKHIGSPGKIE